MKKVLFVMLLVVGIILSSQLEDMPTANASDIYAYTDGGMEYYITSVTGTKLSPSSAIGASVSGYKNGKEVEILLYFLYYEPPVRDLLYQIHSGDGSALLAKGKVADNWKAKAVYDALFKK